MPLIKNGRVTEDHYVRVGDDDAIPDDLPVIIPAERFLSHAEDLLRRDAPTGVAWPNNRRVAELAPYLGRLGLVALNFPTFKDGRGYSQARLLREHGFAGELRATGQILRDQFLFLVRAGFDSLDVVKPADAEAFAATLGRYSVFYQAARAGARTAARQRVSRGTGIPASSAVREALHMR
jgi:uncharacterized protein (DUF934 family)